MIQVRAIYNENLSHKAAHKTDYNGRARMGQDGVKTLLHSLMHKLVRIGKSIVAAQRSAERGIKSLPRRRRCKRSGEFLVKS